MMNVTRLQAGWLVAAASVCVVVAGCEKHPEIAIGKIRENGAAVKVGATMEERFTSQQSSAEDEIADMLAWKLPEGWEQRPPRPLRVVNMRAGEAECYVTLLTGGRALGNINRWRGQMGKLPLDEAGLEKCKQGLLLMREAYRIDLQGDMAGRDGGVKKAQRMLAAYAQFPRFAMSVKMVGPQAAVAAAKAGFDEFCRSLAFKDRFAKTAKEGSGAHGGGLRWTAPAGWAKKAGHGMRYVTFQTPGGSECYVTFLGPAAGEWVDNVRRWVGEIGAPMPEPADAASMSQIDAVGQKVPLLDASHQDKAVLATMVKLPASTMFVKMTGQPADVKEQKASFVAFCKSLRMDK